MGGVWGIRKSPAAISGTACIPTQITPPWYVDRLGDLRCDAIHHDGTNHYLYRVYKDGVRDSQIELLKEKLYRGTATRADITRVTRRLGDDIAKVYGFSIPRQRQAAAIEK